MKFKKIISFIIILIVYILLINQVPLFLKENLFKQSKINIGNSQTEVNIGMSENIVVTVTRNRFYGRIIEEDNYSYIYLFYFIRLPLSYKNFNFLYIHFIFLLVYSYLLLKNGN